MENTQSPKRISLRNSVLKRPVKHRNQSPDSDLPYEHDHMNSPPAGSLFRGFDPFFDRDKDPFSSFGFGGMNHFGAHFDEMMSRFFQDFQPESFADSQFYREDRDLDEDISEQGLDKVLKKRPEFPSPNTFFGGFSRSESTVTRPDGTIERKVTHRDSQGNVETSVTITHPDGTVETITDSDDSEPIDGIMTGFKTEESPGIDMKGVFRKIIDEFKTFF